MRGRKRVHADDIAHACKFGAERRVRADLLGVRDAELVQQLLEDRQLRLQRAQVRGPQLGTVRGVL